MCYHSFVSAFTTQHLYMYSCVVFHSCFQSLHEVRFVQNVPDNFDRICIFLAYKFSPVGQILHLSSRLHCKSRKQQSGPS